MMDLTRRNFIKATLAAGAAAAAGITPTNAEAQEAKGTVVDKWVKGVCRMCGTGCSVYVGVKDGKMVAMKGNVDSKTNTKGFLCVKGMNIFTRKYFYPACHDYECYKNDLTVKLTNLSVVDDLKHKVLCLPFYGSIEAKDLERIVKTI